jgi:hypothetical protein
LEASIHLIPFHVLSQSSIGRPGAAALAQELTSAIASAIAVFDMNPLIPARVV